MPIFFELSQVLVVTVLIAFVAKFLKQPLIVSYIISGIIVGPSAFNILSNAESIDIFSKLGITMLLFIVGLNLNPKIVKEVGSVSLITGVGQVLFTSLIGFFITLALGLTTLSALYVSIALTFSSTIIILKLLSDRGDLHTLYGKIAIGFLLVQDLIATGILLVVSSMSSVESGPISATIALLVFKVATLGLFLWVCIQYLIPKIMKSMGSAQELLFITSLAWALALGSLFSWLGLSIEIGALIAGASLATLPNADDIAAKLKPLRDFFVIIFFIMLGAHMNIAGSIELLPQALLLSLFVLLGNPVIVIIVMNLLGYNRRTGFMAGLTVAQISEFSLILGSLGLQLGHITPDVLTLITVVGLLTITGSTYLIQYADQIFAVLDKWLYYLELRPSSTQTNQRDASYEVVIMGYQKGGKRIVEWASKAGYSIAVVDFDPIVVTQVNQDYPQVKVYAGDIANPEFLEGLPLNNAKLVTVSVTSLSVQEFVCKYLKENFPKAARVFFAMDSNKTAELYTLGAHLVIQPYEAAAKTLTRIIRKYGLNKKSLKSVEV